MEDSEVVAGLKSEHRHISDLRGSECGHFPAIPVYVECDRNVGSEVEGIAGSGKLHRSEFKFFRYGEGMLGVYLHRYGGG